MEVYDDRLTTTIGRIWTGGWLVIPLVAAMVEAGGSVGQLVCHAAGGRRKEVHCVPGNGMARVSQPDMEL